MSKKTKSGIRPAARERHRKIAGALWGEHGTIATGEETIPPMPEGDNPEWTEEDFARARPASEVHGPAVAAQLVRGRGRPAKAEGERKEAVSIRLSPDVLAHFRATGAGWQGRINDVLLEHVRSGSGEQTPAPSALAASALASGRTVAAPKVPHRITRNAKTGEYVSAAKGAGKRKDRA